MKTLELTDDQYNLIKGICNSRKNSNEDFTSQSIFSVQNEVKRWIGDDSDFGGKPAIVESYDGDVLLIENLNDMLDIIGWEFEDLKDFDKNYLKDLNGLDYSDLSSVCNLLNRHPMTNKERDTTDYSVYYYEIDWEDQAFFLTKQESEEYIKYQGHNLKSPRICYHHVGYDNRGSLPNILQLFSELKFKEDENEVSK